MKTTETKDVVVDDVLCDRCGACVGVCSVNCMTMSEYQLTIDHQICIQCSLCIKICPLEALAYETKEIQNTI